MENIKVKGTLVGAESKAYDFEGKKGISNKVTVIVGKQIFVVKCKNDVFNDIKDLSDQKGVFEFAISSFQLKPALELVSFSWVDEK